MRTERSVGAGWGRALAAFLLLGFEAAYAGAPVAYVEAIEGEGVAVLTRSGQTDSGGKPAEVTLSVYAGRPVEVGDVLKTGPASALRLFYQSGARVFVGRGTEFKVLTESPPVEALSLAPLPGGELARGQVRAQVDPGAPKPPGAAAAATRPYRFQVRTRAAVMGVRGTDFVVDAVREKAELHTLSGEVEVGSQGAPGSEVVRRSVRAGQWIEADVRSGVTEVRSFDVKAFEARLAAVQPEWSTLEKKSDADSLKNRGTKGNDPRREGADEEPSGRSEPPSDYQGSWTRFAWVSGVGQPKTFGEKGPLLQVEYRPSLRLLWDRLFLSPRIAVGWNTLKLSNLTNDNLVQIQTSVAIEARILWGLTAHLILGQERWNFGPQPYEFYSLAGGEVGWQFASRSPLLGVRRLAIRWTDSKHLLRKLGNSSTIVEGTEFIGGAVTFEF